MKITGGEAPTMRSSERDFVGALEKGLAVIEAFDASEPRLTLSEVAHKTGLTRAAARRYLLTLARLRYAESDGRLFSLTPRVLRLGYAYLSASPLPKLAQPVLESIGEKTQEVASISILDGNEIVFVARSAKRRIMSASNDVGTRRPAYCTSMGRVLLASRPDAEVERLLRISRPRKFTPKTKTGHRELLREIGKVRAQGYALNDEELEIGLRTIAVPVLGSRGEVSLAMSVSLHSARMSAAQMAQKILPLLQSASKTLSAIL